ncbi:MAG: efflux RND transporter periplasmic adaptor subunit [Phascolarctobacterium sp.]|uniref:efflux RND transporter periplasmic adaptor subunit n=1 Tax=Phascolarctobacterium sp. TaxID=2049039 RepID=UPI0026DB7EC8|nr:efflux RND transporter periplasmic adaptor subunit [Phascolarctobacterium sp.]MDO4920966.1 efflux RND transporter periplasmic adaptor subunit [Phascolarctobacterium sp.]
MKVREILDAAASAARSPKKMLALALVAFAVGGFVYKRYFYQAPQQEALPARVQVAKAAYRDGLDNAVSSTVSLQAISDVEIKAKVEAPVEKIFAQRNQRVRQGALLVELEHANASAKAASAAAQIEMNRANAEAAKWTAANAAAERARYDKLIKDGVVARQEVDDKRTASSTAAADYEQALASIQYAQAELDAARAEVNDCLIRAPFDGIVLDDYDLAVGSKIKADDSIIRFADVGVMKCSVMLPESKLGMVKPGMAAEITCEALPQEKFTGKVATINSYVDTATHTFRADVLIDNAALDYKLLPGMFAQVKILEPQTEPLLCVPAEAVADDGTVLLVYGNKVERRQVQTGASDGSNTVITSGLQEGDVVVVNGGKTLQNGDQVEYTLET